MKLNRKIAFWRKPKKKSSPAVTSAAPVWGDNKPETPEYADLRSQNAAFGKIRSDQSDKARADSMRAGTYSDTDAAKTSLAAEAEGRSKPIEGEALARINALRKQLGLPPTTAPALAPGSIKGTGLPL